MRILHIEDDVELRKFLKEGLSREGFAVDGASDAKAGLQLAAENVYDIILMDLMMPGLDGYWAIRTLRQAGHTEAVFVISGQAGEEDKLAAFDAGADDYMVKPVLLRELVARVRVWMRRREEFLSSHGAHILTAGPLQQDLRRRKVVMEGVVVPMTPKEFMVLECLMRQIGKVVTQTAIAQAVWSLDYDTGTNVVEYHITNIRKKIDKPGKPSLVTTVRGSGYMIDPDGQTLLNR